MKATKILELDDLKRNKKIRRSRNVEGVADAKQNNTFWIIDLLLSNNRSRRRIIILTKSPTICHVSLFHYIYQN